MLLTCSATQSQMLTADQIRETACGLTELWEAWPGGQFAREHAGDGPYHMIVVENANEAPYAVRLALAGFPGVAIPNLCWLSNEIITGTKTIHVVPQLLADIIDWHSADDFCVDDALAVLPFPAPPTEADMADTFACAMTLYDPTPDGMPPRPVRGAAHLLGPAVRAACARIGWRTVADLVAGLDEATLRSTGDVAAILGALTAEPATAG